MHSRDAGGRGCQNILRTSKLVVPAHAGTQGQATEIPGSPLSRERRVYFATVDAGGRGCNPIPAKIEIRWPSLDFAPLLRYDSISGGWGDCNERRCSGHWSG